MKDSDQTFENFFEFGESSTAVALLRSLCRTESTEQANPAMSPLLLYGKSGFGKTHLARACAQELRLGGVSPFYMRGEEDLIQMLARLDSERTKVFVFDGLNFGGNKTESRQRLLTEIIHRCLERKIFVVVTHLCAIEDDPTIIGELKACFDQGSMARIGDLLPGERVEFLKFLLPRFCFLEMQDAMDLEALEWLADLDGMSPRHLVGALMRLLSHSNRREERVSLKTAKKVLSDLWYFRPGPIFVGGDHSGQSVWKN